MEKTKKVVLILAVLIIVIATVITIMLNITNKSNNKIVTDSKNNVKVQVDTSLGENIYSVENINNLNVYSEEFRTAIDEAYGNLEKGRYNFENPLIVYNLYGTNKLSVNLKFSTWKASYLRYTIKVNEDGIADYTNTLKNNGENNLTKDHQYLLTGFVPGYENILKLELLNSSNKVIDSKEIKIDFSNMSILSEVILPKEDGTSTKALSNGLYAILGNDSPNEDYVSLYDNTGVIRGEIPITEQRANEVLFKDNIMYYSVSEKQIAGVNNLGRVIEVYDLGIYSLHHDYDFDNEGNLLVLADNTEKDTVEDIIVKVNLKTKEVTELIDFEPMFKSFVDILILPENETKLDWFHINSLEYVDGDIIVSSRETSSIVKFTDIENELKLKYIISAKELWEGTEFEDYVYEQVGEFTIQGGQHCVRYVPTEDKEEYYLFFYNNNLGMQNTRPDFNYSSIGLNNAKPLKGDNSYYYMYKVNEKNKTFELVDSLTVEYSGIVSSVQQMNNGNIVINSGVPGIFAEYDKDDNLIRKFKVKPNQIFVYRVFKYDFNDFWFKNN